MNVLFICKHNVFRSRIAEAYFKQINRNKKIKVSSGGIFTKGKNSSNQIIAMKKENVMPVSESKNLTIPYLKKQDLIVLTANDIPIKIFNNDEYAKKVILWKIPDVLNNSLEDSYKTIQLIKNKVKKLVKELENKK